MISITELDNCNYDVSSLTQRVFSQFYLTPFKPTSALKLRDEGAKHFEVKDDEIARVMHGAMHASRVTAYVKIIHLFRQDHADPAIYALASFAQRYHLTLIQMIHLTQVAALFHDVAREDEGVDYWDTESANECYAFLTTEINAIPDVLSRLLANTIAYKDNKDGFIQAAVSLGLTQDAAMVVEYLRQLVHDADCLDVMRVRKTFKMQFLDMVNAPGLQEVHTEIADLVKEARELISLQGDQWFPCVIKLNDDIMGNGDKNFDILLKRVYEKQALVYNKITQDMTSFPQLARINRPLLNIYYPFHVALQNEIHQAFLTATIVSEQYELSCPERRDYLFIKFQSPVFTPFRNPTNPSDDDVVALLFVGEVELTKYCNKLLKSCGASVELGFRFCGAYNTNKNVEISGFSLKIIYPSNKLMLRETLFDKLFAEFENTGLIMKQPGYKAALLAMLISQSEPVRSTTLNTSCFFKPMTTPTINASLLDTVAAYISRTIPAVPPKYLRENELGINPTYQDSEHINQPLQLNQKKIWVLRSDFILAVGNKNANWSKFNDTDLPDAIEPALHAHVNWEDRYGHTSLAIPHEGYNGGVLYGGYLTQRNGFIEIYTFSGRYYRQDLDARNKAILEAFATYHLQQAYGMQPVVFIDAVAVGPRAVLDNFELSMYMNNVDLPDYCARRTYTRETIQSIFDGVDAQASVSLEQNK